MFVCVLFEREQNVPKIFHCQLNSVAGCLRAVTGTNIFQYTYVYRDYIVCCWSNQIQTEIRLLRAQASSRCDQKYELYTSIQNRRWITERDEYLLFRHTRSALSIGSQSTRISMRMTQCAALERHSMCVYVCAPYYDAKMPEKPRCSFPETSLSLFSHIQNTQTHTHTFGCTIEIDALPEHSKRTAKMRMPCVFVSAYTKQRIQSIQNIRV